MNVVTLILDPTKSFQDVDVKKLHQACGILPSWATNPDFQDLPLKEALDQQYQFGLFEMTGGTIKPDGTHTYPEDSDLKPLMKI